MKSGMLDVGDAHTIYWEEHGDPSGRPVVVCHGGPGGGLQRSVLSLFDLRRWRVILFDQRGCGRSTPHVADGAAAALRANTTWHLVADMERLREDRGIATWTVVGGSWGSTLALAYGTRHAARVRALVVRGVCLMEPWEQDWMYGSAGAARLAPAAWAAFAGGRTLRQTMRAYGRRFRGPATTRRAAARAWWNWEAALSYLEPRTVGGSDRAVVALAILEHHYFRHNAWLRPGQLLRAARRFTFPVVIVQGRYDLVCPPAAAVALANAVGPKAQLVMTQAGHAGTEPATVAALRAAIKRLLK
jgi:proline iminopeptidase